MMMTRTRMMMAKMTRMMTMATRMMAMTMMMMMMMMMTRLRTIYTLLVLQAPSGFRKQTSHLPVHYDACSMSVWWFANRLVENWH